MLGSTYQANLQFMQTKNAFVIRHEIMNGVRIVPVDGTPHLPNDRPPAARRLARALGGQHARRRHDELHRRHAVPRAAGHGASGHLRAAATCTSSNASRAPTRTRSCISSPSTIRPRGRKPWSGEMMMRKWEGPIFEYACHEGNYGLGVHPERRARAGKAGRASSPALGARSSSLVVRRIIPALVLARMLALVRRALPPPPIRPGATTPTTPRSSPTDSTTRAYAEWWYFNLIDPAQNLQLAVTYTVIDPANLSTFGLSSVAAIAYTPAGAFTETAVYPTTSFLASTEQADVVIAGGSPASVERGPRAERRRVPGRRVGACSSTPCRGTWCISAARPRGSAPTRLPVGVSPWEKMSWLQYMPSAFVSGDVVVDGRTFHVTNVRGYHDHNWGEWVPFGVKWNWAQYAGPRAHVLDRRLPEQRVRRRQRRVVRPVAPCSRRSQYRLVHGDWQYDACQRSSGIRTRRWCSRQSRGTHAHRVDARRSTPCPCVRRRSLPLPLVPVIYEQTADYVGLLVGKRSGGRTWQLARTFRGPGFKEYTGVTTVR